MKRFAEVSDRTLYNLWMAYSPDLRLDEVYALMAESLYNHGYDDVTANKVRRRIKQILHRKRIIPRRPTLEDYKRSRRTVPRAGELN